MKLNPGDIVLNRLDGKIIGINNDSSGVSILHLPTGIIVERCDKNYFYLNVDNAFHDLIKLLPKDKHGS